MEWRGMVLQLSGAPDPSDADLVALWQARACLPVCVF